MRLQELGWWHKKQSAPVTTTAGTTNILAPTPGEDTKITTLTNVNGSDLKVVGTGEGSVKVDQLVNDGNTTFTAPVEDTKAPSTTVAVIIDTKTNKPVATIETKAENVSGAIEGTQGVVNTTAGTTSEVKPTKENPTIVAVLNNVSGSDLKVVGAGEGEAHVGELNNSGDVTFAPDGDSETPIDDGTTVDPDAPVVIIDDGTGLHVGKLTTDGKLNAENNLDSGNTYIDTLVGTQFSVQNFGLLML